MMEALINLGFAFGLLFCRNPATTWISGFCAGTAVSLLVHLYLS